MMASDEKKKKLESLRLSLSKLETQETMARHEGNKRKLESIHRLMERFKKEIENLKNT